MMNDNHPYADLLHRFTEFSISGNADYLGNIDKVYEEIFKLRNKRECGRDDYDPRETIQTILEQYLVSLMRPHNPESPPMTTLEYNRLHSLLMNAAPQMTKVLKFLSNFITNSFDKPEMANVLFPNHHPPGRRRTPPFVFSVLSNFVDCAFMSLDVIPTTTTTNTTERLTSFD